MTVDDPAYPQYLWLVVVGSFAAFGFGYGTGANDVANAFGTSVGAKTLTLKQAVVLAAIFEFIGALVLGRVATSTIAGGIADINAFTREPEVYAYGMVCALSTSTVWQILASYLELNVSSTHSIIGAIIGFGLSYKGNEAVLWIQDDPASIPPYKGVVPIVIAWFFAPIATGTAAAILFFTCRTLVLRRKNAYQLSFWVLPPMVILTVFVCLYFVFTKGAKKTLTSNEDDWTDAKAAWIAACAAAGAGVLCAGVMLPILHRRANKKFAEETEGQNKVEDKSKDIESVTVETTYEGMPGWQAAMMRALNKSKNAIMHGTSVDIHAVVEEDEVVASIHANAEVFDPKVEFAFSYLQVFSACCVVFAHGSGEVGYMAGPLATVWRVYTEGRIDKNVEAPVWVVLIGALGLVIGLATYGYNVTRAMGVRLSKLSPTRGFAAELSTALVIMIAAQYGLPTSSSQCVTGGIIGVGLLEGRSGVNWSFLGRQFSSWVFTLFVMGITTAALFSQGLYAPGKISGEAQVFYEDRVNNLVDNMMKNVQSQIAYTMPAVTANGTWGGMTVAQMKAINSTAQSLRTELAALAGTSRQTAPPANVMSYMYKAMMIYEKYSVLAVGQGEVAVGAKLCTGNSTTSFEEACPGIKLVPSALKPSNWTSP